MAYLSQWKSILNTRKKDVSLIGFHLIVYYIHDTLGSSSYYDRALKSMIWYNKFGIHYLFNDILVLLLSILISYIIFCEHSCLHLLHCMWLRCIRSCIEDLSHEFLAKKWFIDIWFMGLGNPLEVVVHHLLIGGMTGLNY